MAVPVEWLGNFQVNTGQAATGTQFAPKIIGLANGNILVAWAEAEDGAISDGDGTNIIGKIYDAEGKLVRGAFTLAAEDGTTSRFDVAPTNDGGFVLVHDDFREIADDSFTGITLTRYDAGGESTSSSGFLVNASATGITYGNPSVTVDQSNNLALVSYSEFPGAGGGGDVVGYIRADDGSQINGLSLGQNSDDLDARARTATLSNGNFITVYQEDDSGVPGIEFSLIGPNGSTNTGFAVASNATEPKVAALAGGGFAVAYQTATGASDIVVRIFDNNGGPVAGPFTIAGGPDDQNEAEIIALPDGDFVIIWDNDTLDALEGFRLNGSGTSDGGPFTIANVNATSPQIGVTGDGRLLFTWSDSNGEVQASIWDPRISIIDASDYFGFRNFVEGDVVTGNVGATRINGDSIFGLTIRGQRGDDTITGGFGRQALYGGGGNDSILGGESATPTSVTRDFIDGGAGNDTIIAALGDDTLFGGAGADSIRANKGDDTLTGGAGADVLNGGGGLDWASYANASVKVRADLQSPAGNTGDAAGDSYVGIENLRGSRFSDVLRGDAAANALDGEGKNDRLDGRAGDDTLTGGKGADTLTGGSGKDRFVLDNIAPGGSDSFVDFDPAKDEIALKAGVFDLPRGALAAGRFVVGNAAGDANDRIIYNAANGKLWFDPDGAGADAQVLLATLTGAPTLGAGDFVVI